MELPPPSDAQLTALLEQQKKKRTQTLMLFGGIALAVVAGIGAASVVFGKQARKKGDVAYSRAVKCLVGAPLAAGEDPMLRYRSAWRGRLMEAEAATDDVKTGKRAAVLRTMEASEEAKARMWPNRCVAELITLTDTLKEIGAMEEGKKDLGAASRALAKATAGDNWKDIASYQPVLTDFLEEGTKAAFVFADVAEVKAPSFVEARPVDELRDPKAVAEAMELPTTFAPGELVAFVAASNRAPARLCRGNEEGPVTCTPAAASGLPPEASGVPAILDFEDGAAPLLAFGRRRRVMDGEGVTTGVFRGGDGFRLVPGDAFYVGGGWSSKETQTVLLKDKKKPEGPAFVLASVEGGAVRNEDAELADWDGNPRALTVIGQRVYWASTDGEIRMRGEGTPTKGQSLFKLPGAVEWMRGCTFGASRALVVRTTAGGLPRVIVAVDDTTTPAVVEGDRVSCGARAVHVVSDDTIAVCTKEGCQPEPAPPERGAARARVGDAAFVIADLDEGLLVLRTFKGAELLSSVVYDGRVAGGKVLPESLVTAVRPVATRNGAVVAVDVARATSFLGVKASGEVARLAIAP